MGLWNSPNRPHAPVATDRSIGWQRCPLNQRLRIASVVSFCCAHRTGYRVSAAQGGLRVANVDLVQPHSSEDDLVMHTADVTRPEEVEAAVAAT